MAARKVAAGAREPREQTARARASALEPKLSRLTYNVMGEGTTGLELRQDGVLVGRGVWGSAVPVNPGSYTVKATAPGKRAWTQVVEVGTNGAKMEVLVPALEDEPVAATAMPAPTPAAPIAPMPVDASGSSTPPATSSWGVQRTMGVAFIGAGVVSLGVGLVFALNKSSKVSERDDICPSGVHCTPDEADRIAALTTSARADAAGTWIALGIGATAAISGAALILTAPPMRAHGVAAVRFAPWVGTAGAGVSAGDRVGEQGEFRDSPFILRPLGNPTDRVWRARPNGRSRQCRRLRGRIRYRWRGQRRNFSGGAAGASDDGSAEMPDSAADISSDAAGGRGGTGGMAGRGGAAGSSGTGGSVIDSGIDVDSGIPEDSPREACTTITCTPPNGNYCGVIGDGCGGSLDCGTCPGDFTCGGAGTPGLCGAAADAGTCKAATCNPVGGQYCGAIGDGCGASLNCGNCPSGQTCGLFTAHVCGTPCPLCSMIPTCSEASTTTITGKVVTGAMLSPADPVYNATVFIPNIALGAKLPPLPTGASCDRCTPLTPDNSLASALTGPDGTFTLQNVPAGNGIPLVVQLGKWRYETTVDVQPCTNNQLTAGTARLPRTQAEGNIPLTAISTGNTDALECILRKIGVADTEFPTHRAPAGFTSTRITAPLSIRRRRPKRCSWVRRPPGTNTTRSFFPVKERRPTKRRSH